MAWVRRAVVRNLLHRFLLPAAQRNRRRRDLGHGHARVPTRTVGTAVPGSPANGSAGEPVAVSSKTSSLDGSAAAVVWQASRNNTTIAYASTCDSSFWELARKRPEERRSLPKPFFISPIGRSGTFPR